MTEHPLMTLLLNRRSFVGDSQRIDEEVMPVDVQLNLDIGDVALIATANTPLESVFAVCRLIDPSEHAETWPDWEERVSLRSHVLCEIFSNEDPEISHGWVSRVKLVPIPKYRYREARRYLKKGFPEETPDWAYKAYEKFTELLSSHAPDTVPKRPTCGLCGEHEVEIMAIHKTIYRGKVGVLVIDGQEKYTPITTPEQEETYAAHLHCKSCNATAILTDEEWIFPS